jgi:hypothetical protein
MSRKHVPPEPPPSHVDQKVQVHDLEAGRSNLAVARPVVPARWDNHETNHRALVRAPPVVETDRADGWLHRPESPNMQSATTSEEGISRATPKLYSQAGRIGNLRPAGLFVDR